MRLIPYDVTKLNVGDYNMSRNHEILVEFSESGMKCAKVEGWTCKDCYIAVGSLNSSIKRYKMTGIRAIARKGKVYLVNERFD